MSTPTPGIFVNLWRSCSKLSHSNSFLYFMVCSSEAIFRFLSWKKVVLEHMPILKKVKIITHIGIVLVILYYSIRWRFMNHFFAVILNEAFRSPDYKRFFSFILGCPSDFNFPRPFCPFSPVSTQPYRNGQAKLKSSVYGHPRIKLKMVCSQET